MADSSITKQALADALKSLLNEHPFCKVSVGDICETCGMNRKSFYYHFQDKYDLLNWIFYSEFVSRLQTQNELTGWQLFNELCAYLYDNCTFYRRAFQVKGQNSFSDYFHDFLLMLLTEDIRQVFGQDDSLPFYLNFYVDALVPAIRRWLQQKDPVPAGKFCSVLKTGALCFSDVMEALDRSRWLGPPDR